MADLSMADFDRYFDALWGRAPFAWQRRLAERVMENEQTPWPEVIGLPTGSGKTACIDIAVFALAAAAARGAEDRPLRVPRRLFYTVDRRIIVDEAFVRAQKISERLHGASDGILKDVAEHLRRLSGNNDARSKPLEAHVLRGGMYRAEAWARSPTTPTIVCTTVDQLGSRLLFRAYGRSFKAWPIHAGLVANDSLILVDEAHCSRPLLQTLAAIGKYRTWAEAPLQAPFFVSIMSATPPSGARDVFRDESAEPADPEHPLGKRQLAVKRAVLCAPVKGTAKTADNNLVEEMARQAQAHAKSGHRAVVVFCNRVATARAVYAVLANSKQQPGETVLLTGRMRPIDKDDIVQYHLDALASERSAQRKLEQPVYVVATQTLEVGADLDFDALVTECASLDALRQRFGRLNRMGRAINAFASVLVRENQADDSSDDPVYGAALANTWQWLQQRADSDQSVDFGIKALEGKLPDAKTLATLSVAAPLTPVMLPAHVDGWAQTAPEPMPSADVSLFLHGVGRGSADVQVCWRADIELDDKEKRETAVDSLILAPPSTAECLPVPIGAFRRWLAGEEVVATGSDLEGEADAADATDEDAATTRSAIRWRNRNEVEPVTDPRKVRPGGVYVLPASMRDSLVLGDGLDRSSGLDIGDRASLQTHAKVQLRLHPALLKNWPESTSIRALEAWLPDGRTLFEEDPRATLRALRALLKKIAGELEGDTRHRWLRDTCNELASDKRPRMELHPAGGFILHGSRRLQMVGATVNFGDEDDATASGTVDVVLPVHLDGVGDFAQCFARACGLPARLVDALRCAGRLHDLGKADPRFQAILRSGNPWARGPVLAKSATVPQSRQAYEAARASAGYPKGARHELLSVRLAESAPELLPADPILRDLVLHLVASHHGHCRPFAPVVIDDSPKPVSVKFDGKNLAHSSDTRLERLDSGIAERYWRLTRHFGWWGLAWLESILRLADHRRSEWEESSHGEDQ